MRKSLFRRVLAVMFSLLALNAWIEATIGRSGDPAALTTFQVGVGLAGTLAAWGCWTGARWAPVAAVVYGAVAAAMLMALPIILQVEAEARSGIWSGAAGVAVASLLIAWYLRRTLRGDAGSA